MLKRILKVLIGIFVLFVLVVGVYGYKLHALAVEGNNIFGIRCTKVYPPLKKYKTSFLKFSDYMNNPDKYNAEEAMGHFNDYITEIRVYEKEETDWLDQQQKYMDRWDFRLVEPWYIKEAAIYQYGMYEAYRNDARYMLEVFDTKGENFSTEKATELRKKRDEAARKYNDFYDQAYDIMDWRKIFGNVPLPAECTEDVLTIPDTAGSIDWDEEPGSSTPTEIPSNTDKTVGSIVYPATVSRSV